MDEPIERPMLFWELASAFGRRRPDIVDDVLADERWRAEWLARWQGFDTFVQNSVRAELDRPVPLELSRAVAARFDASFELRAGLLRECPPGHARVDAEELTALEVHDRFGGALIEAVQEKGACHVFEGDADDRHRRARFAVRSAGLGVGIPLGLYLLVAVVDVLAFRIAVALALAPAINAVFTLWAIAVARGVQSSLTFEARHPALGTIRWVRILASIGVALLAAQLFVIVLVLGVTGLP